MRLRLLVCAAVAVLSVASAGLVGACSSGACSETLTCDDGANEAGDDATLDSPIDGGPDTGADVTTGADGALDALTDSSTDAFDGSDADARDSSTEAADGPTDALSDALDAPEDVQDAPADVVVEAAPICSGAFACIPAVPGGFLGPVAFATETTDAGAAPDPPPCSAPYAVDVVNGFNNPVFSPATCTCACGGVNGGCLAPMVTTFFDNQCINFCNNSTPGACTATCTSSTSNSAMVAAPVPGGGSCPASAQPSVPGWDQTQDWGLTGRACGPSSASPDGGCSATTVCAPSVPSGSTLCVWQAGNFGCPASYPNRQVLFDGGTDTRGCTNSCTCASPTGVSCSATTTVSSNASCTGATTLVANSGCPAGAKPGCACYPGTSTPFASTTLTATGGSCTPGGSTLPNGTVTPTGPITLCCAN